MTKVRSRSVVRKASKSSAVSSHFSSLGEGTPKMPKEKWDLPESPVQHRPNETSAVEVKFGGTAASLFEHLCLSPSGEILVHDTGFPFEMSCRRVVEDFVANCVNSSASTLREATEICSTPFGPRSTMRGDEYFATG